MNQARGSYQFKTFSIIYGLENALILLNEVSTIPEEFHSLLSGIQGMSGD
jgi:hypothetical protein